MERFVAAIEAHCRPARPDNASMRCDMDAAPRRAVKPELHLQSSRRRTGRSCTASHLRLPCAKAINWTQELITGPCELTRAAAATALHCRLAQVYSRRHAGPRAFIDGVRESAVVSAHSRQSKILVARGCSTRRRESPPRRSSGRLLSARISCRSATSSGPTSGDA